MPTNERLRGSIASAGLRVADLAEAVAVDPKSVERWITKGRRAGHAFGQRCGAVRPASVTLGRAARPVAPTRHRHARGDGRPRLRRLVPVRPTRPHRNRASQGRALLTSLPGVEVRVHGTTLYNSLYRFDQDLLVNGHAFGAPAGQSPVLHLRRVPGGRMWDHYMRSFDEVWTFAEPTG